MKPIQEHKDPRITNISFDNFTGSVYIVDRNFNDENQSESMLTSPRTNVVDHFVPSHHLSLITQPVLGARSRLRKKPTNILVQTSNKDKFDSMTNTHRTSYNDSPPLILPINRIDPLQFQKKNHFNHHHESSDSGLDLSLSTNSSVQLQQYSQQHIPIHRPLSALNEDSSPDDGYHDEHQQAPLNGGRLRFPPVHFGRNRSMEDMISNDNRHEQQHRSSSFSDERQQKLSLHQHGQNNKRASDGAILSIFDPSATDSYQRTNQINKNEQFIHPSITQQHRSLNDLTNKTSNKGLQTVTNNSSSTQTNTRKLNTSTLKPLRKKTKLNIIVEPSMPLTSSRLAVYDEQINAMNGTTSSSSNQTTPRSIRPGVLQQQQQQIKSKTSTPLGHYANPEQLRTHVNRSVVERQHPTNISPSNRRGLIQQLIPFDASPSKVNNFLLRHQNQPTIIFHPSSTSQLTSSSRHIKQTLPTLYNEEISSNIEEEKRKQIKFKEQEERKRFKQKENFEIQQKVQTKINVKDLQQPISSKIIHKRRNSQDLLEQTNSQRYFINSNQRQQEKDLSVERNLKKKTENDTGGIYNRQQRTNINDRHGSGQSTSTIGKPQDNNINRRQIEPTHFYRSNGIDQRSKPTGFVLQNKTDNDKSPSRISEISNQYGSEYSHRKQKVPPSVAFQTRPSKDQYHTHETPTTRHPSNQSQIDQNRYANQWQTSKYGSDPYSWQKSQIISQAKPTRIEPIHPNLHDSRREREASRLSNQSKSDSLLLDDKSMKQKMIKKDSASHFQSRSPTSWSVISEHQQQFDIDDKLNTYQSELSSSPSNVQLIGDNGNTSSRTYRLITDNQQPIDGRHVIPSNNLSIPSSIEQSFQTSSRHTYPFTYTPDSELNNDDTLVDNSSSPLLIETKTEQKSNPPDVYTLPDHENLSTTMNPFNSPSPLVHISSKKKYSSPPPPKKITISTEKDEIVSNYDSDDGWSDDSAELLYVDERYATDKLKMTPSSHLPSQQHYHYHLQQQNVLLQ